MIITILSDTHGLHQDFKPEAGDLLIHAGDITEYGTEEEVFDFLQWFGRQPFRYKIFIGGNHDLFLENTPTAKIKKMLPASIIYLQNSSVEVEGINIYGSPVTPYFLGMAFNAREKELVRCWNKIPANTDILITHGPPAGILDDGYGCPFLLDKVLQIKPDIHCFGHAHEQNGIIEKDGIKFINAGMLCNRRPELDVYKKLKVELISFRYSRN